MKTYCTFKNCSYSCLIVFSLWLWTILACWKTFCCWRNIFWSRNKKKKKIMLLVDQKYSDSSTGYHLSEWKDSTFTDNLGHRIEIPAWRVILVFINKGLKIGLSPELSPAGLSKRKSVASYENSWPTQYLRVFQGGVLNLQTQWGYKFTNSMWLHSTVSFNHEILIDLLHGDIFLSNVCLDTLSCTPLFFPSKVCAGSESAHQFLHWNHLSFSQAIWSLGLHLFPFINLQ